MMEAGILRYVGRDLVEAGLIRNEAWIVPAVAEGERLFATKALKIVGGVLASLHPQAIDYLQQCPSIAVAAMYHVPGFSRISPMVLRERMRLARHFSGVFMRQPRLRDLLADLNLTQQHRRLVGWALRDDAWPVLSRLTTLSPSTLAQAMPARAMEQRTWLWDLIGWTTHAERRGCNTDVFFEWAVRHLDTNKLEDPFGSAAELVDYLRAPESRFQPNWTLAKLESEASAWHQRVRQLNADMQHVAKYGLGWEQPCNYGTLPVEIAFDGVTLVALRSGSQLSDEGRTMRHCVGTYVDDVMSGRCRIYSLRNGIKRLATMEIVSEGKHHWKIAQLKGPCNAKPVQSANLAAIRFIRHVNREVAA
jgi:hypothetical protein